MATIKKSKSSAKRPSAKRPSKRPLRTPPMRTGRFDTNDGTVEAYCYILKGTIITNPFLSPTGERPVDPTKAYGITRAAAHALVRANKGKGVL